jgi:hypothetical protein
MHLAMYASLATTSMCILLTILLHSIPTAAEATYFIAMSRSQLRWTVRFAMMTVVAVFVAASVDGYVRCFGLYLMVPSRSTATLPNSSSAAGRRLISRGGSSSTDASGSAGDKSSHDGTSLVLDGWLVTAALVLNAAIALGGICAWL